MSDSAPRDIPSGVSLPAQRTRLSGMDMTVEIRDLWIFVTVAEELHFGRAAERLGIPQPQVSKQIRKLERELRQILFQRTTRSVRLTAAGSAFRDHVTAMLGEFGRAVTAVQAAGAGLLGRVTLGFSGASAMYLIPPVTKAVREHLPGVDIALHGGVTSVPALARVADGSYDIAFVGLARTEGKVPTLMPGFEAHLLWREPLACAMAATHPLASHEEIAIADLANEPFISFPPDSGSTMLQVVERLCEDAGFTPRIAQIANGEWPIITLAAAGIGVAIMPTASFAHIHHPDLAWRPLRHEHNYLQTALVWKENPSPATRAVLDIATTLADSQDLAVTQSQFLPPSN